MNEDEREEAELRRKERRHRSKVRTKNRRLHVRLIELSVNFYFTEDEGKNVVILAD
jgi:hypothetical protein